MSGDVHPPLHFVALRLWRDALGDSDRAARALSGAFGVGTAGGSSGGSLMERNLDRWTILFAVLFVANTIALLKI